MLETTSSTTWNISYYVLKLDIITDDYCLLTRRFNKTVPVQLAPIKLTTIDLSELGYVNKKLDEFNEIITDQLNKPFIIRHTKWYTIILCYTIYRNMVKLLPLVRLLRFLRRIFCFTKNPHNGDTIPPIIKNFVNCNFNFDMHSEHNSHSQDLVPYNQNQNITQATYTIQKKEETEIPQSARTRGRIWTRRSTIPL